MSIVGNEAAGDPGGERHDRHLRVHADAGREETRVDDVEPANATYRAPAVGRGPHRIAAHARRPHGVKSRRLECARREAPLAQYAAVARMPELREPGDTGVDGLRPGREEDLRDERDPFAEGARVVG